MGMAKRMMEMYEERGYGTSEKIVCHECLGDYYLKDYIKQDGSKDKCDYCGKNRKCVELENLMEPIMAGISSEYEDANDCMSWDSREGGFQVQRLGIHMI